MINPSSPTPPIELVADGDVITSRSRATPIEVPAELLAVLNEICEVVDDDGQVAEASRDWWPLALHWS
ncbi:MAG: hypothetical protein ACKVG5_07805, partial [Acidimicrobiales bacterium]